MAVFITAGGCYMVQADVVEDAWKLNRKLEFSASSDLLDRFEPDSGKERGRAFLARAIALTGPRARPPSDFLDFLDLAEKVQTYSERTGLTVVPVAGSKDRSSPALSPFLGGLTQTMLV